VVLDLQLLTLNIITAPVIESHSAQNHSKNRSLKKVCEIPTRTIKTTCCRHFNRISNKNQKSKCYETCSQGRMDL